MGTAALLLLASLSKASDVSGASNSAPADRANLRAYFDSLTPEAILQTLPEDWEGVDAASLLMMPIEKVKALPVAVVKSFSDEQRSQIGQSSDDALEAKAFIYRYICYRHCYHTEPRMIDQTILSCNNCLARFQNLLTETMVARVPARYFYEADTEKFYDCRAVVMHGVIRLFSKEQVEKMPGSFWSPQRIAQLVPEKVRHIRSTEWYYVPCSSIAALVFEQVAAIDEIALMYWRREQVEALNEAFRPLVVNRAVRRYRSVEAIRACMPIAANICMMSLGETATGTPRA